MKIKNVLTCLFMLIFLTACNNSEIMELKTKISALEDDNRLLVSKNLSLKDSIKILNKLLADQLAKNPSLAKNINNKSKTTVKDDNKKGKDEIIVTNDGFYIDSEFNFIGKIKIKNNSNKTIDAIRINDNAYNVIIKPNNFKVIKINEGKEQLPGGGLILPSNKDSFDYKFDSSTVQAHFTDGTTRIIKDNFYKKSFY